MDDDFKDEKMSADVINSYDQQMARYGHRLLKKGVARRINELIPGIPYDEDEEPDVEYGSDDEWYRHFHFDPEHLRYLYGPPGTFTKGAHKAG